MIRIDLHTHSVGSTDGSITLAQYQALLDSNKLDYIAITDHDTIASAQSMHRVLGERIIVGEEISTSEGELIGLFLHSAIIPGQPARDTAQAIKDQGGLVYVPHPFETVRKGLSPASLDKIQDLVDIVEANNGRAVFQNKGPQAATWARLHDKAACASSDAHGVSGVGSTYSCIKNTPTTKNLIQELRNARLIVRRPPLHSLLYPKLNRFRGKLKRK